MAACSPNQNSISSTSNNPGVGALGAGLDAKSCQVGQILTPDLGCLTRESCQVGAGYSITTGRCVTGQIVTEELKFGRTSSTRHYGRLTITNTSQMELMLQQAGLSNSLSGAMGISNASTRCSAWISRGTFAVMKSFPGNANSINITLGAGTSFPYDLVTLLPGLYGSQVGVVNGFNGSNNYISFSQSARNYSFNNGNGMQIVGMSPSNTPISLMMLVNDGNLGADHLEGQLVFQGVTVATIPMDRF